MSYEDLLTDVSCGSLDYMCCMSLEQALDLNRRLKGMTEHNIKVIYNSACACRAASNPSDACGDTLLGLLCDNTTIGVLIACKEAVDLALLAVTVLPVPFKSKLIALGLLLEMLQTACTEKKISKAVISGACSVFTWLEDLISSTPDKVKPLLTPLERLKANPIFGALQACCDPTAPTPSWATSVAGADVTAFLTPTDATTATV
jgi:hypothetical protein